MINNLTTEEENILTSYERGEWRSVSNIHVEMDAYRRAASDWMSKNHTISLILPEHEFEQFQQKAFKAGLSSQTLLINLIHQFIAQ